MAEKEGLLKGHAKSNTNVDFKLHEAVSKGLTDEVKSLLNSYDIDITDDEGNTPLHIAVSSGNYEITNILLEKGGQVNVINCNGDTVLHLAAREDRTEIMESLVKFTDNLDIYDKSNKTPMHVSALKGHTEICEILYSHGADLNAPSISNNRPLHFAIKSDHLKTSIKLVELGAKLDVQDSQGNVPLHLASEKSSLDSALAKLLVTKGVGELQTKNKQGNTPLHVAAEGGHFKTVEYFIDHNVQIDVQNCDGDTPLHLAACGGYAVTAKLIINANKQVLHMKNNDGQLAVFKAAEHGKAKALGMFLEMYAKHKKYWEEFKAISHDQRPSLLLMAVNSGHEGTVLEIVKSSFWQEFVFDEWYEQGNLKNTPIRKLIRHMPEVAEYVLDQCIKLDKDSIIIHYDILDDTYCHWETHKSNWDLSEESLPLKETGPIHQSPYTTNRTILRKNHPMRIIVNNNREKLMDHPVLSALLRRKWKIAFICYLAFLVFYSAFVAAFSALMISTPPPFYNNLTCSEEISSHYNQFPNYLFNDKVLKGAIFTLSSVGILIEIVQLILLKPVSYLKLHNLYDWFTYISPILVVTSFNSCSFITDWQWQLGVASLFVSYMNLLFFLRIIPVMGIYIMMIILMLHNFMKFFFIMLLFIISFAICFFLLTQNHVAFSNVYLSIMKNYVMMVGEMDFDGLFMEHKNSDDEECQLHYEFLTWVLFITFLVFMSLVIMNLLTSLAVQGIDDLLQDSKYKILSLQIKISLEIEFALPEKFHRSMNYFIPNQVFQKPNEQSSKFLNFVGGIEKAIFGSLCKSDIYQKASQVYDSILNEESPKQEDLTVKEVENCVARKTKVLRTQVKDIDRHVEEMHGQMNKIEKDLQEITTKLEMLIDAVNRKS